MTIVVSLPLKLVVDQDGLFEMVMLHPKEVM
jgi:hypothetical protein